MFAISELMHVIFSFHWSLQGLQSDMQQAIYYQMMHTYLTCVNNGCSLLHIQGQCRNSACCGHYWHGQVQMHSMQTY